MKRYVYAMSFNRSEGLRRAQYYAIDILEHLIKILVYHDIRQQDVDHWINEISSWLKSVDSITIKPSNKHLKPSDVRDTTFSCMGDHLQDYLESLRMFQHDNKKGKFNYEDKESYPPVEPDNATASDLMDICYKLIEKATPLICDKVDHSRQDYADLIRDIFSNYL